MKSHILELFPSDFASYLQQNKIASFRLDQLYNWLYRQNEIDFEKMTTLSKKFREKLKIDFDNFMPKVIQTKKAEDDTTKYLLELKDDQHIEMVIIPFKDKNTLCLSSQVGCARGCHFCATAKMGLIRNLEVYEIVSQIKIAKKILAEKKLTNLVFMGMGEPLDNFENVVKAIKLLQQEKCFNISPRRITVSTSGIIPKIAEMVNLDLKLKLAVSLNAAIQSKREKLMPVAKQYPLTKLKNVLLDFQKKSSYRITFEYVLIKNFNMQKEDSSALRKFLGDLSCKLNLIKWNPVPGISYQSPSDAEINDFIQSIQKLKSAITFRKSRGDEIQAACGQLAVLEKMDSAKSNKKENIRSK